LEEGKYILDIMKRILKLNLANGSVTINLLFNDSIKEERTKTFLSSQNIHPIKK